MNRLIFFWVFFVITSYANSDSIKFNNLNNHGVLGLINMPSARFFDESSYGLSIYRGDPDRKIVATFYPYDWLEGSLFYASIKGKEYGPGITQDYKDKGFNIKLRIKDEGIFPSIAIGFNDFAGTGLYSSEYIVASYGIDNIDFSFGAGWGNINGEAMSKNPLSYIHDGFLNRPEIFEDEGGQLEFKRYFSDSSVSYFGGINYVLNQRTNILIEYDPTKTPGVVGYDLASSNINYGINYAITNNLNVGLSYERGNYLGMRLSFKDYGMKNKRKIKSAKRGNSDNYDYLKKILNSNQIGVSEIAKERDKIQIDITQNSYNSLDDINDVIDYAIGESSVEEEVIRVYKIAGLTVKKDDQLSESKEIIYKNNFKGMRDGFSVNFRPFIASREDFLKGGIFLEYDNEYIFSDNFFFSGNLKLSLYDNFDDLTIPPVDTYPNQVRSDIKKYLNNLGNKPSIGRAQFDYFKTLKKNHHVLLSAGIFEEMFSGYGFEYIWYDPSKTFSTGFELHHIFKRDYNFGIGLLDYDNYIYSVNLFHRLADPIDMDTKISIGEFLAGDKGIKFEFSRTFANGTQFGVFATFTDVTTEQFGEGSFDKGIFFKIPVGFNSKLFRFLWRPLTKDPGATLVKKNDLYNLVNRYRNN